jgi:peptide/nickel transport system substrate-binding protein
MGVKSPAIEALVTEMVNATSQDDFVAAVRALDRVLTTGRYVLPVWHSPYSRLAHSAKLKYPENTPVYGDWIGFQPDVWWYED